MRMFFLLTLCFAVEATLANEFRNSRRASQRVTLRESPLLSIAYINAEGQVAVASDNLAMENWVGIYTKELETEPPATFEMGGGGVIQTIGDAYAPFERLFYFTSGFYHGAIAVSHTGQLFAVQTHFGDTTDHKGTRTYYYLQPLRYGSEPVFAKDTAVNSDPNQLLVTTEGGAELPLRYVLLDSTDCAQLLHSRGLTLRNARFSPF